MAIFSAERKWVLAVVLAAGIGAVGVYPAPASAQGSEQTAAPGPAQPEQPSASADQIFADLVKHNDLRNSQLHDYSAVRTYSVGDLQGKIHAKTTVRMTYVAPDKKEFVAIAEEGSSVVRHLVLNRLMESEVAAAARSLRPTMPSSCLARRT